MQISKSHQVWAHWDSEHYDHLGKHFCLLWYGMHWTQFPHVHHPDPWSANPLTQDVCLSHQLPEYNLALKELQPLPLHCAESGSGTHGTQVCKPADIADQCFTMLTIQYALDLFSWNSHTINSLQVHIAL